MSKFTKKKHVIKEMTQDALQLPTSSQFIVRVVSSRGNNLHEVENADGERLLASMPTKFRRNIWITRKNFLLVEPIEEGVKVRAEIVAILTPEHVSYYHEEGIWPEAFGEAIRKRNSNDLYKHGYDPLTFANENRVCLNPHSEDEDEDKDKSSDEDVTSDEEESCDEEKDSCDEEEVSSDEEEVSREEGASDNNFHQEVDASEHETNSE